MADTLFYIAPACWYFKNKDKIFGATVRKNVIDEYDLKRNRKKLTIYFTTDSYSKLNEVYGTRLDIAHKRRSSRYHESKIYNYTKPKGSLFTDNCKSNTFKKQLRNIEKMYSVTSFNTNDPEIKLTVNSKSKSCHQITMNPTGETNLVVNTMSNCPNSICFYTNRNPYSKFKYKVYRCQLNTQEESCCCSCNSDAMFEVMKSLYDCYKKKNCDNCNCILCGHLPREERRLGELRKSGKSPAEKEKSFREMAIAGTPLPEGKTKSEKDLIKKVRTELGLPQEPITSAQKRKMSEAYKAGLIKPLEGKSTAEKEEILTKQAELGIPLPEGRTLSEKALIEKIKASVVPKERIPSAKLREAKAAGLLTPLEGKSKKQKEKILRGLAMQGLPLPEAKTASDQKLIDRVRAEVGLPPEPKTPSTKEKYNRAMAAGIITPLEGKPISEKENILRKQAKMGLQLPEGRTPSEKALIAKIKETVLPEKEVREPSEKLRKAKAAGFLTPLQGKSKEQKEKILKGLAMQGIPFPEAKTASEQKLMDQVRTEVGLPPEPKTPSVKEKYNKAMAAGLITPLEGKSIGKKERILRDQAKIGLPLPEGRTPSEKALIAKIKETVRPESVVRIPSEKLRKAKAAGLLTPLAGKSKEQKEKILRGLAMQGIPLPEAKTSSEQKLMDQVRAEVGLPPEPKTPSAKEKYNRAMAAGLITPLEGKSIGKKERILRDQAKMGLPLPEGRTPSEKALIAKIKETVRPESVVRIPSEKLRKVKAAGLLTPLQGKPKEQKEKILKDLAMQGIPFPEAKTASEQKLMDRVRTEVGLPPEPKTPSAKEKYNRAMAAGLITPLEGKSASKKEEILRGQAKLGLPLPEGRTPSEKALIEKVRKTTKPVAEMPAGRPALPPEKLKKLDAQTAKIMKEKKGPSDECICDLLTPESERKVIKPHKITSEKLRKAKAAGLLTPLQGKSKEQKEKILKDLAMQGLPLPEAKTASEQKLIDRVRNEVGLPPEPKTPSTKEKYSRAMAAGLITPLEGKSIGKKERILRDQAKMGLPLPEGRTPSEKALIAKIKETVRPESVVRIPSEKLRKAKAAGFLTPLQGKSKEQKEKILKGLAMQGIPFPEAKTASEQKLMDQVRAEVGLPPEPKTPSAKEKYNRAMAAGLITPLEGKSIGKKERILRDQAKMGLPLPEGRTPSEKALIAKIKETVRPESVVRIPSEKLHKAKATGLLTPLAGKSKEQKEKILRGLAMQGIPLPEAKTSSEQKLMDQVRAEVGLPPEPKTPSAKEKYNRAMAAGLITPLEGKSIGKKERILRDQAKMGLPLPEGRTPSEKALIAKIKETVRPESVVRIPSEKLRKAKAAGLLTPLAGKSKEQKEKILRGLAMQGIPLPEAKTSSEQKLMDQVRAEVGLPPEPKTPSAKEKYNRAMAAGLITPLEGKSIGKKERILRDQAKMGLPLPEGRTPSEKALIAKIKETVRPESVVRIPSEKLRKAKAAGLLTPLAGKSKEQKEKILRGLAMQGIPLPEAKTSSEQKLMDQVRAEVGLPPELKTPSAKEKYNRAMAAGLITPLEGKSIGKKERILRDQAKMGLPLPEGRTPSEKALIAKIKETIRPESVVRIPSEKLRKVKAAGLLTPLQGKPKEQKEKILKDLAMQGIPFPEAKTASEQKLMDRVRTEVGLPPEPKTPSAKEKYNRAMAAGLITPLEGKSASKKEEILRGQAKLGLPLPEGRTPSEKALIEKVRKTTKPVAETPAGRPALPPEKLKKLDAQTAKIMKEKKGPSDECICDLLTPESERKVIKPHKITSEKLRKAKAAGLLTPLQGKSKEQKEKILKDLAMQGLPLPEAKTASEQKLIDRVRNEVGLPPEPKTPSTKEKYSRAMAAGLITPLEGKSIGKKERILRDQAKMGLPLPEGRTPSEKALIAKIKETVHPESVVRIPSEKLRKAKAAGFLTPLQGKSKEQKEKILKGLAMQGIPFPEAKTASEQKLMDRVRTEVGLPPEPKTPSAKEKYNRAMAAGLITPLESKSIGKKERILRDQAKMGLPLPEGRTPSEKALIAKIKETVRPESVVRIPSEKLRKAKTAGLLTPLAGKSKEQKEKILRGLAMQGIPLPEAKTSSEQKLMDQVRAEVGLPPEPKTPSAKEKYNRAMAAGLITPLEGKSIGKKERILRDQAKMGLPLAEGRTPSEKALIAKIKETVRPESVVRIPSEKLRKAKTAGLLTPLAGKSKEQKEKILRGLAMQGIPLPEAKTSSEQKLMDQVRAEVGLPPEPKTPSAKEKYNRAMAAGLITPLEGKSIGKKERILRDQAKMGLPLPEGRTPSEKALIAKIKETLRPESVVRIPSEKLRKVKAAGLLTPLQGKPKEQKEKILKGMAMQGIPFPEAQTASEQKLMDRVRTEVGLPPEPKTPSAKEKYNRAMAAGLITPLEGKSAFKKEEILRGQAKLGLPLPEGRTPSEKALIEKVRKTTKPVAEMPAGRPALPPEKLKKLDAQTAKIMKEKKGPSDECICDLLTPESERKVIKPHKITSEKLRKAKATGLLTPLQGKSKEQKEKILKGLAMQGLPLPEAKTASEQKLIDRVRNEVGLPPEPKTPSTKEKYNRAMAAGLITPLEGKSIGKKERILRDQAKMGLPLPEGRTPSEKALIAKIKETTSIASSVVPIPSEKLRKAKAAGLLTPLEGKSLAQKEKILKGLAEAGLPMPEGTTPSEKALIKEIRTKAGLPLEATPSEKRKTRKKSKKIGVSKSKGGIVEEFEDITKITTCDRGCGCDKKKIRFKHSYVKIRVTSPDISSLCPCPEECIPGVKGGVFTDNEGIKVTIGRVTGVPSFPSRELPKIKRTFAKSDASQNLISCIPNIIDPNDETIRTNYYESFQHLHNYNDIQINNSKFASNSPPQIPVANAKSLKSLDDFYKEDKIIFLKSFTSTYGKPHLLDNDIKEEFYTYSASTSSSIESFYLLKTDSCLNFATSSDTFSVISISITETSSCSDDSIQKDYLNSQYDKIFRTNESYCSTFYTSESTVGAMDVYSTTTDWSSKRLLLNSRKNFDREILLLKTIQSESYQSKHFSNHRHQESLTKYDISSSSEILDTVNKVLSKGISYDSSSLLIIMPTSSDEYEANHNNNSLDYIESTIYIQLSENCTNWNPTSQDLRKSEKQKKTSCTSRKAGKSQRVFSSDTTEDRPCCCKNMEENGLKTCSNGIEKRNEDFVSELVTPMIRKEAVAQVVSHEADMNTKHQKKSLQQSPTTMKPTLRFCKMPPSGRHKNPTVHPISINDYSCNELSEPRSPGKAKNILEISKDNIQERSPKPDLTNTPCNVCAPAKREKCNKMVKNSEEKNCCPCSFGINVKTSQENGEDQLIMKNGETRIKKNKNILCECPEELHPEFQFDEKDWIDETQIRKMKSDLTQTVSGFKLNVPRKMPEPEMSFEEILKFYAENAKRKYERNEYEHIKPQTKDNASADCRCPPAEGEVEEPPADSEEPFQGIKFHIGGKGSGSKGLAGILCFQLFEEASLKQAI